MPSRDTNQDFDLPADAALAHIVQTAQGNPSAARHLNDIAEGLRSRPTCNVRLSYLIKQEGIWQRARDQFQRLAAQNRVPASWLNFQDNDFAIIQGAIGAAIVILEKEDKIARQADDNVVPFPTAPAPNAHVQETFAGILNGFARIGR